MLNEPIPEHFGPNQMAPWIALMGRLRAPAETAARLTGEPLTQVQGICDSLPPAAREASAEAVTQPAWFLATSNRRYHGAFILSLYGEVQGKCPPAAALTHVYSHYIRVTLGNPEQSTLPAPAIDFKQASDLVDYFFLNRPQCSPDQPELSLEKCHHCGSLFLEQLTMAPALCPCCFSGVTAQPM